MAKSDEQLLEIIWDYMAVSAPLTHADAIVVGGCKDLHVADYAAKLYLMGFAPTIAFSGFQQPGLEATEAELFARRALALGVPESAILREPMAANTGQNIRLSQELLANQGIVPKKVILVHKPYMSRRFLATAQAQWTNPQPEFIPHHEQISLADYIHREGKEATFYKVLGDFGRMRTYPQKGFQTFHEISEKAQQAFDELMERGYKIR